MKLGEPFKVWFHITLFSIFIYSFIHLFIGQTQYRIGFEKAFSLLKRSISEESGEKKKRVILFLTDGAPSDEKTELIFETIRDRNFELNNSVIILTYGFGKADQAILEDIAKQNTAKYGVPANTSVGDIPVIKKDIKSILQWNIRITNKPPNLVVENAASAKGVWDDISCSRIASTLGDALNISTVNRDWINSID